jgi:L-lactate dehydrogenase (cytochrome)
MVKCQFPRPAKITILRTEIERTMKLCGVSTLDELEPRHVTQL